MNKFTKISATALFALFLTACDKPADKPANNAKPETAQQTEAAKPAEATQQTEAAKPAEATKPAETAPALSAEEQEKADYEKLVAWNQQQGAAQAQSQQKLQQELQAAIVAQDENKAKAAIEEFNKTVQASIASLDALEIKSDLIKSAQTKTKNVLALASELLVAQANVKDEAEQKVYVEKAQQLQNEMQALAQLSAQIEAKLNPAPAQAPAAK
ncbi:lipoprotein HlpB [Aggregatibacter sp. HMT-949]|uniref:lipoprotein HlpB n=1 Tax=Aggregatibacter sp. HMT-949 TaxID=3235088 RepID=UPI00359C2B9F